MKIIVIIFFSIIIITLSLVCVDLKSRNSQTKNVKINNVQIKAEIANNNAKRELGLSGRDKLESNAGMLFIYPISTTPCFWMKNMYFTVDIIWIDQNQKIIDITDDVQPSSYPNCYRPTQPIKFVLEVNKNVSENGDFRISDRVFIEDLK